MLVSDYVERLNKKPFRIWFTNRYEEYKLDKEHLGENDTVSAAEYLKQNKVFLIKQYRNYRNGN